MTRRLHVLAMATTLLAAPAHAESTAPRPSPSSRVRRCGEMSVGYGRLHGETYFPLDDHRAAPDVGVLDVRWAVGAAFQRRSLGARLGAVLDIVDGSAKGLAFGIEGHVYREPQRSLRCIDQAWEFASVKRSGRRS